MLAALDAALAAQQRFDLAIEARGREVLASLPADKVAAVILGRSYNTTDPELNLHLVEKLISLDVLPIPFDYLPLSAEDIFGDYRMMYWPSGQKLIAAARIVARDSRLAAVYLGNFRCGPDSFISHYVREEMKGKPYLQLEVDEHSARRNAHALRGVPRQPPGKLGRSRAGRRRFTGAGDPPLLMPRRTACSTSRTCVTAPMPSPPLREAAGSRPMCFRLRTRLTSSWAGATPPPASASP